LRRGGARQTRRPKAGWGQAAPPDPIVIWFRSGTVRRLAGPDPALRPRGLLRRGDQAFALGALAGQLAGAAHRFRLLAGALLGGLFIVHVPLHLAERAFALHLLLERLQRLVDVVVANENLDD